MVASSTLVRCAVSSLVCLLMTVYSSELTLLIPHQPASHECGCSPDCICRGPDRQCSCRQGTLSIGAACGCGAQTPTADAPSPPFAGLASAGPTAVRQDVSLPLPPNRSDAPDPGLARKPPNPP